MLIISIIRNIYIVFMNNCRLMFNYLEPLKKDPEPAWATYVIICIRTCSVTLTHDPNYIHGCHKFPGIFVM